MKRKFHISTIILLFIGLFLIQQAKASHYLASDFSWSQIGKDSFLVSIIMYRDCNGVHPGDQFIYISCNTSTSYKDTIKIAEPSGIDVTPVCNSSCSTCETRYCTFPYGIEKYVYSKVIYLKNAGSCCEIKLSTNGSMRTTNLTTTLSDDYENEAIINRCLSSPTNSPVYSGDPTFIACVGLDFQFSIGASDYDIDNKGQKLDSLSFEWTPPLHGAGTPISYTGSYTYDKPLNFWGFPNSKLPFPRGLQLDPANGDVSFRPMKVESTITSIIIKEWRNINGTMTNIGSIRRDLWICVISCPNNHSPILGGPYLKEVCAGETVSFIIKTNDYDTKDTLHVSWDKSIPNAKWIDGNDSFKHPNGYLSWKTKLSDASSIPYVFTVTVEDDVCPLNGASSITYQIFVKPYPKATFDITDKHCGNFVFSANNISPVYAKCRWTGKFSPGFVLLGNGFSYQFDSTGKYLVELELDDKGCKTNYDTTIIINSIGGHQKITFDSLPLLCITSPPIMLNSSAQPDSGKWTSNVNSLVSGDTLFPYFGMIGKNKLYYQIFDSFNCVSTDSTEIEILDLPIVNAGNDDVVCPYASAVSLSGTPVGGSWSGKGISGSTFVTKDAKPGSHTLIYSFNNGICINSDSIEILVTSFPDTNLTRTGDSIFAATGMKSYSWYCNDTLISNQFSDRIKMNKAGSYNAIIEDSNQCSFKTQTISGTLGFKDLYRNNLIIIPNPADNYLYINYKGEKLRFDQIKISNSIGKTVIYIDSPILPLKLNINDLSKGVYFVQLTVDGALITKKIFVR